MGTATALPAATSNLLPAQDSPVLFLKITVDKQELSGVRSDGSFNQGHEVFAALTLDHKGNVEDCFCSPAPLSKLKSTSTLSTITVEVLDVSGRPLEYWNRDYTLFFKLTLPTC